MERKWAIRAYREEDESKILELRKAVYPAEGYNLEQLMRWWNWKYRDNPAGAPTIWFAESAGKLAGQYAITRVKMKIGNEVIIGSQSVDTMTHPDYRHQGIFETLASKTYEEAGEKGIHVVYGFPNEYSYPGFIRKLGWFDVCALHTMIKPLNLENILRKYITKRVLLKICTASINLIVKALHRSENGPKVDGLTITKISSFDERINDLWEKVSNDYKIIVVRDKEYLNWRYVDIPNVDYAIYLAEKEGQILGYTVLKCEKQQGLIFGRIFDLVVPLGQESIAHSLILKAIDFFKEEKADLVLHRMIGDEAYCKTLRKSGFIYSRFVSRRARFIARPTTPKISEIFLRDPRHWFVQAGDSDAM